MIFGKERVTRISREEIEKQKGSIENYVSEKDRGILSEIFVMIEQLTDNPDHQIVFLSELRSIVTKKPFTNREELERFKSELQKSKERRDFLGKLKWAGIGVLLGGVLRDVLGYIVGRLKQETPKLETTPSPTPSPTETQTPSPAPTPPTTPTETSTPTPTSTPEATPPPEPTPTPEGFISRERIKEWADGAVERIINEIENQNQGVRIKGVKLEFAKLGVEGYMVYIYSIIWDGDRITINKEKMRDLVKLDYFIEMKEVYSGESGRGVVYHLKPLSPLIHSIRIVGHWVDNYKGDEFSPIEEFSVTKKTEEEKGKPVLILELKVDPNNPEANPPFSTSTEK